MIDKELESVAKGLSIQAIKELITFSIMMVECNVDYTESVKELKGIIGEWN